MNKINNIEDEETRKNSKTTESNFDDEGHKEVMDKIQKEKTEQKKIDEKKAVELTRIFLGKESYNNIDIGEYEKLLKIKPEQINIVELIEDLNKGKGFREDINKKLQSNLIDSISPDDIYREFSSGLKEMPFMAKVLSISDFDGKKNLLEETIQKNNEITDEYFNEKKLDELSNTLGEESINYVLNDENLSGLVKGWENLETPRRLYIANKIVKNLSTKFGINVPYVTNINFGKQDLTMGSKGIINLNLNNNMFNNFHDFLAVLVHEFTHCLQDNYKTPGGENGIKKAKQYYFNGVTGDNRLENLGKKVHDSSLLEKEAYYVQRKIKEMVLKIKF